VQRLQALDIATGAEKLGGPVVIAASVSGTGTGTTHGKIIFDPHHDMQRAALLLLNGVVYIAGGRAARLGDGYNARTLAQVAAFCTTPNGAGGVWQADNDWRRIRGNIYFATGTEPSMQTREAPTTATRC